MSEQHFLSMGSVARIMARSRRRSLGIGMLMVLAASAGVMRAQLVPAVIPLPTTMTVRDGAFTLTATTTIVTDRASHALGRQLARLLLEPATGYEFAVMTGAPPRTNAIVLGQDASLTPPLGAEGYRLVTTPARVEISAGTAAGVYHG